jgi:NADH-quinone oxidoreductase subunit H
MTFWSDPDGFLANWLIHLLAGIGIPAGIAQAIGYALGAAVLSTGALLFVLFLIWLERKLIGRVQDRLGPNRLGPWGIFQSIADMLKIFTKEYITPDGADKVPYNLSPILTVGAVIMVWAVVPLAITVYGVDLNVGLLYIIAVGSLGEMGILMAGWGSNNKYALLGAFRAAAQLISYEVPMVLSLLIPVMLSGSLNMNNIVQHQDIWYVLYAPLAAFIFFITSIAEVGRAPFDLTEAESELVAGFNIEYSGLKFGMFYVADFLHSFTISLLVSVIFLGGWRGPGAETSPLLGFVYLILKTSLVNFIIIIERASLPRFRIDQMMDFTWKVLTPVMLILLVVTALLEKTMALVGLDPWLRSGILFILNIVLLFIADTVVRGHLARRPRPDVRGKERPIARPENYFSQPGSGA